LSDTCRRCSCVDEMADCCCCCWSISHPRRTYWTSVPHRTQSGTGHRRHTTANTIHHNSTLIFPVGGALWHTVINKVTPRTYFDTLFTELMPYYRLSSHSYFTIHVCFTTYIRRSILQQIVMNFATVRGLSVNNLLLLLLLSAGTRVIMSGKKYGKLLAARSGVIERVIS